MIKSFNDSCVVCGGKLYKTSSNNLRFLNGKLA